MSTNQQVGVIDAIEDEANELRQLHPLLCLEIGLRLRFCFHWKYTRIISGPCVSQSSWGIGYRPANRLTSISVFMYGYQRPCIPMHPCNWQAKQDSA